MHGLKTGKEYVFRVKSVGRAGNSNYSEASHPIVVKSAICKHTCYKIQLITCLTSVWQRFTLTEVNILYLHTFVQCFIVLVQADTASQIKQMWKCCWQFSVYLKSQIVACWDSVFCHLWFILLYKNVFFLPRCSFSSICHRLAVVHWNRDGVGLESTHL